jgi:hypothetical protein
MTRAHDRQKERRQTLPTYERTYLPHPASAAVHVVRVCVDPQRLVHTPHPQAGGIKSGRDVASGAALPRRQEPRASARVDPGRTASSLPVSPRRSPRSNGMRREQARGSGVRRF